MSTELKEKDVIEFPVPKTAKNKEGIIKIDIQVDGKNIKHHDKWVIPMYWRQAHSKKLGQYASRLEYTIDVDKGAAKWLEDEGKFPITPYPMSGDVEPRKQRFIDVVNAYNDLYNKTGRMRGRDYDMEKIKELGRSQTQAKWINMAKALGLFSERGQKQKPTRAPSITEKELEDFQAQPLIAEFYKYTGHQGDKTDWQEITRQLQKALFILDLTPEDFQAADDEVDFSGLNQKEVIRKWEAWFTEKADEKTWTAENGSKWSLNEWAESTTRPFFSGVGNETTDKGQRIGRKFPTTGKGDSESQQKQFKIAIKHFGETLGVVQGGQRVGTWFEMPSTKLKYPTLKMTAKQIEKAITCLSEVKTKEQLNFEEEPVYGAESDELVEDKIPDLNVAAEVITTKQKKVKFETTQEDWKDAHLYFMIGLDVGWRASEGLTATYGLPEFWKRDKSVLPKYQTGVWTQKLYKNTDDPTTVMKIKFLTRKTWKLTDKAGNPRTTHTEMILTPATRDLLQKRVDEIKMGIMAIDEGKMSHAEILEKYKIRAMKKLDGKLVRNYDHVLIGYDGKYIETNSVKFPSSHKLTLAQKKEKEAKGETIRQLEKVVKNEKMLHAIMRQCLRASGVDLNEVDENGNTIGEYWLTDSLHAIRHVFAQKWLLQSHWNFSFVTKKGHWGSSQILEDAYGGVGERQHIKNSMEAAKFSLEEAEKEADEELTTDVVEGESHTSDTGTFGT